jgi:peptidoglycan/LPS O-acetylase OafA/YrhL
MRGTMQAAAHAGFDPRIHGLRGVCAVMVFVFHAYRGAAEAGFLGAHNLAWDVIFDALQCGVDFFFMISGYLIMGSLMRHGSARAFLLDRAIRICPAYYVPVVLIFLGAVAIGHGVAARFGVVDWLVALAANLSFVAEYSVPSEHALKVAWSLDYEVAFYLYAATIFVLARRRQSATIIALVLATTAPVLFTLPRFTCFFCGVAAYFWRDQLCRTRLTDPRLCVVYFLLTIAMLASRLGPGADTVSPLYVLGAVPGTLFFVALLRNEGRLARLLSSPAALFFGAISYSFYLWHTVPMFFLKDVSRQIATISAGAAVANFIVLSLVLAVAISCASYALLEVKAGRFLRDRFSRAPTPRNVVPVSASAAGAWPR